MVGLSGARPASWFSHLWDGIRDWYDAVTTLGTGVGWRQMVAQVVERGAEFAERTTEENIADERSNDARITCMNRKTNSTTGTEIGSGSKGMCYFNYPRLRYRHKCLVLQVLVMFVPPIGCHP